MQYICNSVHIKEIYYTQFVVIFLLESMKNMTTTSEVAQHLIAQRSKWVSWNIFHKTYVSCFIVFVVPLQFIEMLHHTNSSYFMQFNSSGCTLHYTIRICFFRLNNKTFATLFLSWGNETFHYDQCCLYQTHENLVGLSHLDLRATLSYLICGHFRNFLFRSHFLVTIACYIRMYVLFRR